MTFWVSSVKAQESTWYNQTFEEWYLKVYDNTNPTEIFGERYTAAQVQWIIYSLAALPFSNAKDLVQCGFTRDLSQCAKSVTDLTASIPPTPTYANNNPQKSNKSFLSYMMEDRPISAISYVKNQLRKFDIIPTVQAQSTGSGFQALGIIQSMWTRFRDISYFVFIIIILVMSFMIMFRIKISPQAVITIQSALPKLILGVVFVSFSYAIAGLLIDLMYVVLGLLAGVVFTYSPWSFSLVWDIFTGSAGTLLVFIAHFVLFLVAALVGFLFWATSGIGGAIGASAVSIISVLLPIVIFIALFILVIVYIVAWFKLIMMLLKTVANIFLTVIFSPLLITFGVISGSGGIGSYIKSLITNLMVFPVVGVLLILSFDFLFRSIGISLKGIVEDNIIMDLFNALFRLIDPSITIVSDVIYPGSIWNPPFISEGLTGFVFAVISLMLVVMTPKVVDIIKSFMEGKPFGFGSALGEAVSPAITVGRGVTSAGVSAYEGSGPPSTLGSVLRTIGFIKR